MRIKKIFAFVMVLLFVFTGCRNGKKYDITVISREDGSGTRGAFVELFGIVEKGANGTRSDKTTKEAIIANKTDVMITNVAGEEHAIGYTSIGSISNTVKAVKIDGAEATAENVKNGSYKVSRPFNIVTRMQVSKVTQDFIDYIFSADGQKIVAENYIAVNDSGAVYSGTRPDGKVVVAGSSSVSPVIEKLKEGYMEVNPNAQIEIQTNDSTSGITATVEGTCDIGMSSRELTDSEEVQGVVSTAIALDGIAVIINPKNSVENLSAEQIKLIFTGRILTWGEV